jgi:serine protease Do
MRSLPRPLLSRRSLTRRQKAGLAAAAALLLAVPVVTRAVPTAPPTGAPQAAAPIPGFSPTVISDVAEKVTPAVVNVTTRRMRAQVQMEHPFFRDFFGPGRRAPQPEMGAGSGVVISSDGLIVTNNHVVEGADEVKVTFADEREFVARVVGTDKPSDLAFLRIDAKDIPHLEFGDSSALRLGEFVLAVGNPFGVGQTVTMGIVSAKGRANVGIVEYEDFIQTDASINPGNSGGALVNMKGQLVGINTAILSRSGGAQGIGFAVPTNMVRPIRDQIASSGRVRRGWLGVAIQDLTPEIARSMNLKVTQGVLISDVMEGGPAAKASLEAGDVVVSVDGQATRSASQLRNRIALTAPGTRARLAVLRQGQSKELSVTLEEKKDEAAVAAQGEGGEPLLSGLSVQDLGPDVRRRLQIPGRVDGVVVSGVEPGSAAERAGLEEGDVITGVDRQKVKNAQEFAKAASRGTKELLLRVFKRGVFTFVVLKR